MIKYVFAGLCLLIMLFCVIGMIGCIIGLIKNDNTYKNRRLILDAINRYNLEKISQHSYDETIDHNLMESYDDTFKRISDWGYTNILPPEQFELIKPYIKTGKKKEKNS